MTNNTDTLADLDYAIAKAADNIAKAVRAGMTRFAQDTRRERKRMVAQREALAAA